MLEIFESLWFLLSIFFSEEVMDLPLFQIMLLFNTLIGLVYMIRYIFSNLARVSS